MTQINDSSIGHNNGLRNYQRNSSQRKSEFVNLYSKKIIQDKNYVNTSLNKTSHTRHFYKTKFSQFQPKNQLLKQSLQSQIYNSNHFYKRNTLIVNATNAFKTIVKTTPKKLKNSLENSNSYIP